MLVGLLVVGVVWLAAPWVADLLGGGGAVSEAATGWLRIAVWGAPGILVALAGHGWMRGVQYTRRPIVVVLAGNHDSDRRLQAVEPLLELGRVITRPVFARPDAGGVVEVTSRDGAERAKIAVLPFLSQRYVVKAADLMGYDAQENGQLYDSRVRSLLETLCACG